MAKSLVLLWDWEKLLSSASYRFSVVSCVKELSSILTGMLPGHHTSQIRRAQAVSSTRYIVLEYFQISINSSPFLFWKHVMHVQVVVQFPFFCFILSFSTLCTRWKSKLHTEFKRHSVPTHGIKPKQCFYLFQLSLTTESFLCMWYSLI